MCIISDRLANCPWCTLLLSPEAALICWVVENWCNLSNTAMLMALSLINTKLSWSQFVHSCVSHPRFPVFDIILQHCYYVKSAVQAQVSFQYLRGWRGIRPCPGSPPITQRECGVLLIARDGSFFFFCRMFCQRWYQRSGGLVGMAASWEHISKCYCLWSFSLSLSITLKLSPFTPPTTPPPTPSFLWPIWVWRRDSQNKY